MVMTPGTGFEPEVYRVDHYEAYYQQVKTRLDREARAGASTYPEPCDHCSVCDWWKRCDQQRRDDDHLSLVAGITRIQRNELTGLGIETLERFRPGAAGSRPEAGTGQPRESGRRPAPGPRAARGSVKAAILRDAGGR